MKKILILANSPGGLYRFRKELIQTLIEEGNEIFVSVPYDEILKPLEEIGVKIINTQIDRRGMNPLKDSGLIINYLKLMRKFKPDLIITYTIKPNIYGAMISRLLKIPYVVNITGLGSTFQNNGFIKKMIIYLYKLSLRKVKNVFFENEENKNIFINYGIIPEDTAVLLNGAGVNLEDFRYEEYPKNDLIRFLFIGRVMREKGIEELFYVAEKIKLKYKNVEFIILGGLEEDYKNKLRVLEDKNIITYLGYQKDVRPFIKNAHCVILPSHHEGMSNTLLEGAAMGRPLITSDIYGCKEAVVDKKSGYTFEVRNSEDLYRKIEMFINIPIELKEKMGIKSRKHIENYFDKQIVIEKSMIYINEVIGY